MSVETQTDSDATSDLTQIKGIGAKTAPKIVAKTGIESADDLIEAYLTDVDASEAVRDAVPNKTYLHEYIRETGVCDRDIDIDREGNRAVQALLFARQIEYVNARTSQLACDDELTTNVSHNYDGNSLVAKHVSNDDMVIVDAPNVMLLVNDYETFADAFEWSDAQPKYHPVDSVNEYDGEAAHTFTTGDGATHISNDYVERATRFFQIDVTDTDATDHVVLAHEKGGMPIIIHARNMVAVIAPRIMRD